MKDVCVCCGAETAYEKSTHIEMTSTIINTPNNSELGSKVRQLYYETR